MREIADLSIYLLCTKDFSFCLIIFLLKRIIDWWLRDSKEPRSTVSAVPALGFLCKHVEQELFYYIDAQYIVFNEPVWNHNKVVTNRENMITKLHFFIINWILSLNFAYKQSLSTDWKKNNQNWRHFLIIAFFHWLDI